MILNFPIDIRAEALLNYFADIPHSVELCGPHKRNVYEDSLAVSVDEENRLLFSFARNGIYDIVPECLFHPIDRFDTLAINGDKDRIKEEIEEQKTEEKNAREFFARFDRFVLELGRLVQQVKDQYAERNVLSDIIADSMPEKYLANRFVRRSVRYLPLSGKIRGDKSIMSFILRNVLLEEGLALVPTNLQRLYADPRPEYNSCLGVMDSEDENFYLGNEFEEEVTEFVIRYWNEDECTETFLQFVSEMAVFEQFVNDFFAGIETVIRFSISTDSLPVRLSDEIYRTYLDYNTNL